MPPAAYDAMTREHTGTAYQLRCKGAIRKDLAESMSCVACCAVERYDRAWLEQIVIEPVVPDACRRMGAGP